MALSYVGRAGSNSGATRGPAVTVTTSAAIAAGDLIIVSVSGENVGDLNDLSSVTDSAGNTYVSAIHTVDGGQNTLAAVWYCANCLALANGSTVTVTFTSQLLASGESWEVTVDDVSGAATSSVTDGTNSHNSQDISSPTTWDTNSITTTNAADLLWVAMGNNQNEPAAVTNAQSAPTTGWTIQTGIVAGPSSHNGLRTAYQIVSATGTYKGGGTAQAFGNGVSAVIVAFKQGAGGGTPLTAQAAVMLATAVNAAMAEAVALSATPALGVMVAPSATLATAVPLTAAHASAIMVTGNATLQTSTALTAQAASMVMVAPNATMAEAVALTASPASMVMVAPAAALSTAVPLAAQAALGVMVAGNAALATGNGQLIAQRASMAMVAPTATLRVIALPPPVMPRISLNAPAFGSNITYAPSRADNSTYGDYWRSTDIPSVATPIWLAYDLSGVATAQRARVMVNLLNEQGNLYLKPDATDAASLFTDYKIQGNTAAGGAGSAPVTGWVDLVTVTGNLYPTRQHVFDFTGYNWLRLSVTAASGTTPNNDVSVQMDVHDAHLSTTGQPNPFYDSWLFLGDSITLEGMLHPMLGGGDWGYGGALANLINSDTGGAFFPATIDGGNGGMTMAWAATNITGLLANFTGGFVSLAFGTNDANQSFQYVAGDSHVTTYYANLLTCIDAAEALGALVVVPYVPYGSANAGDLGYNANLFNQYVDAHLATDRPGVKRGPNFWNYFNTNPGLLRADGIHPTYTEVSGAASGHEGMHLLWASWMLANIYLTDQLAAQPALATMVTPAATLSLAVALLAQAAQAVMTAHNAALAFHAPPPTGLSISASGGPSGVATAYTATPAGISAALAATAPAGVSVTGA